MSQFLPEQPQSAQQTTDFKPVVDTPSLEGDVALMQRVFSAAVLNPSQIPTDFLAYFVDFLQTQRLNIPLGQVIGYTNATDSIVNTAVAQALSDMFVAHISTNETEVHFTGTSYATISGGPTLTGLDDGHYVVWFGASISAPGGDAVNAAVEPNSSSGSISAALEVQGLVITEHDGPTASYAGGHVSASRAVAVTLAAGAGANRLDVVYKTALGHDCDQRDGWMIALKYSN